MTRQEAIRLFQTTIKCIDPITNKQTRVTDWNIAQLVEMSQLAINALEKQVKYKWHDLRKNPEDLPSEEGYYICKVGADYVPYRVMKYEVYELYAEDANRWHEALYPHTVVYNHFVLAWREIEPFEEDE